MRYATPLATDLAKALRPPPAITPAEWAARYRRLPVTSAARGAKWSNATCPYLVGILNSATEIGVRQITVQKGAQLGLSEALTTILGYYIHVDPCSMLMIQPTAASATSYVKERFNDLQRATPVLRRLITDRRVPSGSDLAESSLQLKMYPGGFAAFVGSNSPVAFSRWSARIVIGDDVARWPDIVGQEGNPIKLAINRAITYLDARIFFVSTPVLAADNFSRLFEASDKRRYHLQCPGCRRWDWLTWSDAERYHVAFTEREPSTARLVCPACGYEINDPTRRRLLADGQWRPTATPVVPEEIGYSVTGLLSPFRTLADITASFLTAHQTGPMRLKEFVTTVLAEPWRDPAARLEESDLLARCEDY